MKREGPSFTRWLFGRIAHPRRTTWCGQCGASGADVSPTGAPAMCVICRRSRLTDQLAKSLDTSK